MDPISNINQLIEVLQRQAATRTEQTNIPNKAEKKNQATLQSGPADISELRAKLTNRIKAIDLNDKRRYPKATRIFLETILSNEFGDSYLSDAKFTLLLEDIQTVMEADPEIKEKLHAMIDHLAK